MSVPQHVVHMAHHVFQYVLMVMWYGKLFISQVYSKHLNLSESRYILTPQLDGIRNMF